MSRRRGRHYAPRRSNRPAAIATVAVATGAAALSALTDGASAGTLASASLRVSDAPDVAYAPSVKATPDAMRQAIAQRSEQTASRSQQRVSAQQVASALRARATNANALKRLSLATSAKPYAQPVPATATTGKHAAAQSEAPTAPKQVANPAPIYSGDPRSIAMSMLSSYGWGAGQFGCLNNLWNKESGWRVGATNGSSGAYGIPQSLPGSKMATAGADWRTNPATQIRWGLGYIKASYGSPCGAWAHSVATNWY